MQLPDAALAYAKMGWPVLPLHSPEAGGGCSCGKRECQEVGKHPRVRGGVHAATTNEATVRVWWRKWPNANIGIATGPRSFDVLDVDGEECEVSLARLSAQFGPLPATREHGTGRGRHLCFAPSGFPCSIGKLGAGLDTKGTGGYVVAPPSIHANGVLYTVTNDTQLALAPAWIVAQAEGCESSAVAEAAVQGAPEGTRNSTVYRRAWVAAKDAPSPRKAKKAVARLTAVSTLSRAEAEDVRRKALKYGGAARENFCRLFRRVPIMMTRDPRFRARSAEAKFLALLICTGEGSTAIPGVAVISPRSLADEASLPEEATRHALRELSKRGLLRSDLRAGVLWLPFVTKQFRNESPNAAQAWRNTLDRRIPRCSLWREIEGAVSDAVSGHSRAQNPGAIKRALETDAHKEEGSPSPVPGARGESDRANGPVTVRARDAAAVSGGPSG